MRQDLLLAALEARICIASRESEDLLALRRTSMTTMQLREWMVRCRTLEEIRDEIVSGHFDKID